MKNTLCYSCRFSQIPSFPQVLPALVCVNPDAPPGKGARCPNVMHCTGYEYEPGTDARPQAAGRDKGLHLVKS
jgi:hypothetical protein